MLGGNLRWTSVPSRGSRNTPSRFILQKPEISAGTDEPSGSPNYDWGRLYLPLPSFFFKPERIFTNDEKIIFTENNILSAYQFMYVIESFEHFQLCSFVPVSCRNYE